MRNCRAPKQCWVSSVIAAGVACRAMSCSGSCSTRRLYLLAYGRLYSNNGAMTPGVDGETADGMSLAKIGRIIDALRHERFRFQPGKAGLHPEEKRDQ